MGNRSGKRLNSVEEDVVEEDVVKENVVEDVVKEDAVEEDIGEEDVISDAIKRKATEATDNENPPKKKRRRLDSIPCDNELDVVSKAVKRQSIGDHENQKEKHRRLDSIPCDNEMDVVSEALKRQSIGDHENPPEKRRRLDTIPCDNEMPSTSQDTESRNEPKAVLTQRRPKRKAIADDEPGETKTKRKRTLGPSAMFKAKYKQLEEIGEGQLGFVFAGYRKADYLDVAIKHMPRAKGILYVEEDYTGKRLPMEAAVMLKLAAVSKRHSAHVDLLDWYELEDEVILVLERPMPAVNLLQYIDDNGGRLKEKEAKIIMRQLVDAVIDLHEKHIFHRDIKVENVLIQTCLDGIRVRIIDFGASCFFNEGDTYEYFMGTHIPPECFTRENYTAGPSSVFQMGGVLFDMVQTTSFKWDLFYEEGQRIKGRLSKNCRYFIKGCLHEDPDQRLTLTQLKDHPWLR
ncbi:serine/threonine-protein kinase pim-1-like [Clinocottus analis]|uniref:serine/threonine-protein kinase pim-1-like n=1 Tax=Clinocottus analis TaxID=304258 RepID=UPI0035BEDE22